MGKEALCFSCKHGELKYVDGKEYYICYALGGVVVEPRTNCPLYEEYNPEEDELLQEIEWEEPEDF